MNWRIRVPIVQMYYSIMNNEYDGQPLLGPNYSIYFSDSRQFGECFIDNPVLLTQAHGLVLLHPDFVIIDEQFCAYLSTFAPLGTVDCFNNRESDVHFQLPSKEISKPQIFANWTSLMKISYQVLNYLQIQFIIEIRKSFTYFYIYYNEIQTIHTLIYYYLSRNFLYILGQQIEFMQKVPFAFYYWNTPQLGRVNTGQDQYFDKNYSNIRFKYMKEIGYFSQFKRINYNQKHR